MATSWRASANGTRVAYRALLWQCLPIHTSTPTQNMEDPTAVLSILGNNPNEVNRKISPMLRNGMPQ